MEETIITTHCQTLTIDEAKKEFNLSEIHQRFGAWCVTDYGIECLSENYSIEKTQLILEFWISHMAAKRWVNKADFKACYYAALKFHFPESEAA